MVAAEHQLAEKLIFFWHGHWATSVQKVKSAALMLGQLADLPPARRAATSRALVQAMLRDPALISGWTASRTPARRPNENLARELMELFTLGIGNYTEDDVKAAARALTGWTVDRGTGAAPARPAAARRRAARRSSGRPPRSTPTRTPTCWSPSRRSAEFLAGRLWFRFASASRCPPRTGPAGRGVRPAATSTAMLRALFTDAGVRGHPRPAGQAAGGVGWSARCASSASDPADLAEQQRKQLLGRAGRAGPGAAAAAERRRLAGRRGLADHLVAAGPAAAGRSCWPARRTGRSLDRLGRRAAGRPAGRAGPAARRRRAGPTGPAPR